MLTLNLCPTKTYSMWIDSNFNSSVLSSNLRLIKFEIANDADSIHSAWSCDKTIAAVQQIDSRNLNSNLLLSIIYPDAKTGNHYERTSNACSYCTVNRLEVYAEQLLIINDETQPLDMTHVCRSKHLKAQLFTIEQCARVG